MTIDVDVTTITINGLDKSTQEVSHPQTAPISTPNEGREIHKQVKSNLNLGRRNMKLVNETSLQQPSFFGEESVVAPKTHRSRITSFIRPDWAGKMNLDFEDSKIHPKDIEMLKPIGSGSFGTVYLW